MGSRNGSASVPDGFRALQSIKAIGRAVGTGVVRVFVRPVTVQLDRFVEEVHADIAAKASAASTVFDVSVEELKRYFVTGIRARVGRVNNDWRTIRVDADTWAMPHNMAYVINAIGRVNLDLVTVMPLWDKASDPLVLTLEEQQSITRRIRALRIRGFDFAQALERSYEGYTTVMTLTPIEEGWAPIPGQVSTVSDAVIATLLGIEPAVPTEGRVSTHPLFAPQYVVRYEEVERYLFRVSEVRVGRQSDAGP